MDGGLTNRTMVEVRNGKVVGAMASLKCLGKTPQACANANPQWQIYTNEPRQSETP